jgi:hypothetical protein
MAGQKMAAMIGALACIGLKHPHISHSNNRSLDRFGHGVFGRLYSMRKPKALIS